MSITLTAVYRKCLKATSDLLRSCLGLIHREQQSKKHSEHLIEAVDLVIQANRALAQEWSEGEGIV